MSDVNQSVEDKLQQTERYLSGTHTQDPESCECGTKMVEGSKFCHGCGKSSSLVCLQCGTTKVENSRFCHECGGMFVSGSRVGAGADDSYGAVDNSQKSPLGARLLHGHENGSQVRSALGTESTLTIKYVQMLCAISALLVLAASSVFMKDSDYGEGDGIIDIKRVITAELMFSIILFIGACLSFFQVSHKRKIDDNKIFMFGLACFVLVQILLFVWRYQAQKDFSKTDAAMDAFYVSGYGFVLFVYLLRLVMFLYPRAYDENSAGSALTNYQKHIFSSLAVYGFAVSMIVLVTRSYFIHQINQAFQECFDECVVFSPVSVCQDLCSQAVSQLDQLKSLAVGSVVLACFGLVSSYLSCVYPVGKIIAHMPLFLVLTGLFLISFSELFVGLSSLTAREKVYNLAVVPVPFLIIPPAVLGITLHSIYKESFGKGEHSTLN